MVRFCALLLALIGLAPETSSFYGPYGGAFGGAEPFDHHAPQGGFWDSFNTRMHHIQQAAHHNAAHLESVLRRLQAPTPPLTPDYHDPFAPPVVPARRPARPVRPSKQPVPAADESDYESEAVPPPPERPSRRRPTSGHRNPAVPTSGPGVDFDTEVYDDSDFGFGGFQHGLPGGFLHGFGFGGIGIDGPRLPPPISQPWWKGPNVCVSREETEENGPVRPKNQQEHLEVSSASSSTVVVDGDGLSGAYRLTSCQQTPSKYICTTTVKENDAKKTSVVRHQCCHGYRRSRETGFYCTKVTLDDVVGTARNLGATMFAQSIEASGIDMKALRKRNLTLFAPSDDAMKGYNSELLEQQNEVEVYHFQRRRREAALEVSTVPEAEEDNDVQRPVMASELREMVLSHVVPGILDLSELVNEQVLYTESSKNSSIRMNVYPGMPLVDERPLVTANCVPVRAEAEADNGAVALVDRVLPPVTKTLAQVIEDSPALSTFKKLLEKSGEWEALSQPGHMTVFAPSEEAFRRLPDGVLAHMLEGEACGDNVARHHLTEYTLCSACIRDELGSRSMAGEPLRLSRGRGDGRVEGSEAEHLKVEGATITKSDVVATNGVLHVIDAVLMPRSARTLSQALTDRGLTSLVRALGSRGLLEELNSMRNVTVFAPSESALRRLKAAAEDPSREALLYHVANTETASCDLQDNLILRSRLEEKPLRVNLFQTMPTFGVGPVRATVQCARLVHVDELACGAVVHELDRVLTPPAGTILDALDRHGGFATLLEIIKGTKYEARLREEEEGGPLSLLAPTDEAFARLLPEVLEKLKTDLEFKENVLSKHILTEVLCCEGVATPNWPFTNHVSTDFGTRLPLRRGPGGELHVGPLAITTCDIMATNGVVHAVEAVRTGGGLQRRVSSGISISARSPKNPDIDVRIHGL